MPPPRMDTAVTVARLGTMLEILDDARAIAETLNGTRAALGVQALREYLEIERERLRDGGGEKPRR